MSSKMFLTTSLTPLSATAGFPGGVSIATPAKLPDP
ncbi:hypothetical protein SLEP1_g10512 [Rubroshorea leprosula]|uniref:Uncharacterized protein n=1 Tax=Rubroshorea leprosula TaxID=152421 RepID=A0AAV5IJN0_9ROSI|nr:hypothetical protein SLEP1_g10512 [Rubroshorea leprosula]